MTTAQLCAAFEIGESTVHAKARIIERALGTQPFDPQWTLPSLAEKNPLVWMAEVNGLLVDLRDMPREVQEIAWSLACIAHKGGSRPAHGQTDSYCAANLQSRPSRPGAATN